MVIKCVATLQHVLHDTAGAFGGPGDDIEASCLGSYRILREHDGVPVERQQHRHGRRDDVDILVSEILQKGSWVGTRNGAAVQEHGLLAELWFVRDPVEHVVEIERLGVHFLWLDASGLILVDHLLGVGFLTAEDGLNICHFAGFKLRRHLCSQALKELNALLMGQESAAGGIQVRAPVRGAAQELLDNGRVGSAGIHFAAQRLEFGQCQVTGAAFDVRAVQQLVTVKLWRDATLVSQIGPLDDVGRGVQIALIVAADQLSVAGEGHVAFEDASSHARGGRVRLLRVLGKLQARAPVADRKIMLLEATFRTPLQSLLEVTRLHFLYEVERAGTELHLIQLLKDC